MFQTLRSRLWLTYALLIALILSIMGVALFAYVVRNPIADRQSLQTLNAAAKLVNRQVEERNLTAAQRLQVLKRISQSFAVRLIVLDSGGEILFDESPEEGMLEFPRLIHRLPPQGRLEDASGDLWLYSSTSLTGGEKIILALPRAGGFQLLRSSQLGGVLREEFIPAFLRTGLLALILAVILALWMGSWISRPLDKIGQAAEGFTAGEYQPIKLQGPTEVRALAKAFNEMGAQVEATRQSQRDFVANVSHELKTPLTSIQGFAQAILDGTVDSETGYQKAAGIINTEAQRMYRLVVDLLDLARLDAGTAELEREIVDIRGILMRTIHQLMPQAAEASVTIRKDLQPLPTCLGDQDRLAQVFTNLIDNAIKHTPEGKHILIRTQQVRGNVVVEIIDSGPGIPEQEQSRIFERFYQIDKSRGKGKHTGTGLGLAISRQLVIAHQGKIDLQSQPGKGSRFTITLPAVLPEDETVLISK